MRLFIAIPLPDEVKNIASLLQQSLDKKIFRLTKIEQIHITIAFLGEVDKNNAPKIIDKLKKIQFHPFVLKTKKFGFFPSENKIRVVWIGLEENEEFKKLQHNIRSLFNFKEKLMPHITIARAKQLITNKENPWNKSFYELKYDEADFTVNKFILYESIPGPEEHTYKEINIFKSQ